jgi:trans-2,3-dihydro-3-hydroxyanthranilate isomerase
MTTLRFRILNVFTEPSAPLSGNPLCVFEDGSDLDDRTMQALALQFNLSETTFILPSARAAARVRIFTPAYEMPFAGHPTLGTAHVCRALGRGGDQLRLETQAGIIPVNAVGDRWTLTALAPTWRELDTPREVLATALGLEVADLGTRPLWVKAGKEQLVVPLTSQAAVRRVQPEPSAFAALRSEDGHSMAYVFAETPGETPAETPAETTAPHAPRRTLARFFFPQNGALLEDPATGSATANFGGWCLATGRPLPLEFDISQGAQVGRPSRLYLSIDTQRSVRVGGDVIELGYGTVKL